MVGGVLGIPAGVFEDASLDHPRNDDPGVPHAEPRARGRVLHRHGAELLQEFGLAQGPVGKPVEFQGLLAADRARHRRRRQGVQGIEAEALQHFQAIARARTDMTGCESVGGEERVSHGGSRGPGLGSGPVGVAWMASPARGKAQAFSSRAFSLTRSSASPRTSSRSPGWSGSAGSGFVFALPPRSTARMVQPVRARTSSC